MSHVDVLAQFDAEVAHLRSHARAIDVHTHLGADIDGRSLTPSELLALLDAAAVEQACVFALNDPEREPAYRLPNDRVLDWAVQSAGRLFPFCRLDPATEPIVEAERCLARGARGIKLHPRSQAFELALESLDAIFTLAEDARVPILIHAGRGLPPIATKLAALVEAHPDVTLILAHAAIADQGEITTMLEGFDGVCYDSSTIFALDILELLARVPAERIVFGSDPPYGRPASGLYMLLRCAAATGLDDETISAMLGGTISAMLERRPLPKAHPPRRSGELSIAGPLLRAHSFATMALVATFQDAPENALGGVDLGLAVCRDPRAGSAAPALERIAEALSAARELLAGEISELGRRQAIDLIHRALTCAVTEPA